MKNALPLILIAGAAFLALRSFSGIAQATGTPSEKTPTSPKDPDTAGTQPKSPDAPITPNTTPQEALRQALIEQGVPSDIAASVSATSSDGRTYPESTVRLIYQNAAAGIPGWVRLSDVGGIRLNGWEWNYYRMEALGLTVSPPDAFEDMSASRSASEYIAALHAGGLHGLGARIRRRRS